MVRQPDFKPHFFPHFVAGEQPIVCEKKFEKIALVLSGIDPTEWDTKAKACSLRELVAQSSVRRIGPSSAMRQDYQYVLSPQFDFNQVDFGDIWLDAKQIPSGQEGTDFLKLAKQIRHLNVVADFDDLLSKKPGLNEQVRKHSHRLLHRIHRTATRQIEETLKTLGKPSRRPWYTALLNRFGLGKDTYNLTFHIDEEVRRDLDRYVEDVIKIGCLLRSNVRRR